jgi:RNA processing factor Prp31
MSWNDLLLTFKQEWYGWHFPEMAKIITDNLAYAKTVKHMGMCCSYTAVPLELNFQYH